MSYQNAGSDSSPSLTTSRGCKDPGAAAKLGTARAFSPNEVIFWEGDSATKYYRVTHGAVRLCKSFADGRRQVVAFHLVDEIFGFERSSTHAVSAEATTNSSLLILPVRNADGGDDEHIRHVALNSALFNLERAHLHAFALALMLAPERIATFLLDLAERLGSDAFDLPMSRIDVADYLGLTLETVSRTLTGFARQGLIRMPIARRNVVLCDKPALTRLRAAGRKSV